MRSLIIIVINYFIELSKGKQPGFFAGLPLSEQLEFYNLGIGEDDKCRGERNGIERVQQSCLTTNFTPTSHKVNHRLIKWVLFSVFL